MLEFCQTVKPSLEDYEADGVCFPSYLDKFTLILSCLKAWPTLLDDFVTWKKNKTSAGNGSV